MSQNVLASRSPDAEVSPLGSKVRTVLQNKRATEKVEEIFRAKIFPLLHPQSTSLMDEHKKTAEIIVPLHQPIESKPDALSEMERPPAEYNSAFNNSFFRDIIGTIWKKKMTSCAIQEKMNIMNGVDSLRTSLLYLSTLGWIENIDRNQDTYRVSPSFKTWISKLIAHKEELPQIERSLHKYAEFCTIGIKKQTA